MQNRLQLPPRGGVGENNFSKFIAAQLTVRGNQAVSESDFDFIQRGLPGLDEFAREFVGVHDLRAAFAEKAGGGGFAHARAAGQTANLHGLKI